MNIRVGADIKTGAVFCRQCDNFIYDSKLDEIYMSIVVAAEEKLTKFQCKPSAYHFIVIVLFLVGDKNPRQPFEFWVPSEKDIAALEGAVAIPCQGKTIHSLTWPCSAIPAL
jgi:ubiquitin carboxyl-terminal hydrolase 22/27/51